MKAIVMLALLTAATLEGADAPPAPAVAAARAALAGAWKLDPARSEDARQKTRSQREEGEGPEGRRRGPGGGMGGRGGGMGGSRGGVGGRAAGGGREGMNPEQMREAMDEVLMAPEAMAITIGATEVEILARDGRVRRLRPNGNKVKREGSARTETRDRWDGSRLQSETWVGGGMMQLTETWTIDPGKRELLAELKIENRRRGGEPIVVKRVYVADAPAP